MKPGSVKGKAISAEAAAKKIVVGLSGGSNSAVAAALLKSQGFHVQGVFLQMVDAKTGENKDFSSRCCRTKSESSAREVCRKLDIPLYVVNVASRFEDRVVDGFIHDLLEARLPNPCLRCHLDIRFSSLLAKADELGCEKVATGHHAQVVRDPADLQGVEGAARLTRANNVQKDQSYFLFGLSQLALTRLIFPLGGLPDFMIAKLVREFELPDESLGNPQAICLASSQEYIQFFEKRVALSLRPPGAIRMVDGTVLGEHTGLHTYRIGHKVKLAPHVKEQEKYQVTGFDVTSHALIIGSEQDRAHSELRASRATWIKRVDGLHGLKTSVRFYPSQKEPVPCRVTHFENATIRVELEQPSTDMIVGQAIVFYDGDEVLGGAYVDRIGALGKG